MSFRDRVDAFMNKSNDEVATSPSTGGIELMDQTEQIDQGVTLDLRSAQDCDADGPALASNAGEEEAGPPTPVDEVEAKLDELLDAEARQDRARQLAGAAQADADALAEEIGRLEGEAREAEAEAILGGADPTTDEKVVSLKSKAGAAKARRQTALRRIEVMSAEAARIENEIHSLREAAHRLVADRLGSLIRRDFDRRAQDLLKPLVEELGSARIALQALAGGFATSAAIHDVDRLLRLAGADRPPEPSQRVRRWIDVLAYSAPKPAATMIAMMDQKSALFARARDRSKQIEQAALRKEIEGKITAGVLPKGYQGDTMPLRPV